MTTVESEHAWTHPRVLDVQLGAEHSVTMAMVPMAFIATMDIQNATTITAFLTEAELAVSRMHRIEDRRLAHLAGRVAVKLAVIANARHLGLQLDALDIGITQMMAGHEQGRPVVQLPAQIPMHDASITHSHRLAAAVVSSRYRVGLDIERIAPRTPAFVDEAFDSTEQSWLHAFAEKHRRSMDEAWNLGWCIKEAQMKLTGHGLRDAIRDVGFAGWNEHLPGPTNIRSINDEPFFFAQSISLHAPLKNAGPLPGFIALMHGYAWAILMNGDLPAHHNEKFNERG